MRRINESNAKYKIFSDEKKFSSNSSSKTEYCTRLPGQQFDSNKVSKSQVSNSEADVNCWTYIGPFGKGML